MGLDLALVLTLEDRTDRIGRNGPDCDVGEWSRVTRRADHTRATDTAPSPHWRTRRSAPPPEATGGRSFRRNRRRFVCARVDDHDAEASTAIVVGRRGREEEDEEEDTRTDGDTQSPWWLEAAGVEVSSVCQCLHRVGRHRDFSKMNSLFRVYSL